MRLSERKAALERLLGRASGPIRFSEHIEGYGESFGKACHAGLEGIVSNRADAPYRSGRVKDWLKTKCTMRSSPGRARLASRASSRSAKRS